MAELTPIPSAQRPADPDYQPVSGYAVAAGITAGVFALILAVLTVVAVTARRTALSYELLVLPVIGVVLAAIARSHIRHAEGTRTGLRLANVSWWVCVLGGVGFFAYLQANTLVLERESGRYADRFFDELKAGRVHDAFVYVLPPEERGRGDPKDPDGFEAVYGPAGFAGFKSHDLVRLVVRNGAAVELARVGVRDVGQEAAGFQATHLYRLTCPEGTFDVQVKLVAAESKRSRQPQWYIPGQPTPNFTIRPDRLSRYGRAVAELQMEGDAMARAWMSHLSTNHWLLAQLLTAPRSHGHPIESAVFRAGALGGGPAFVFPLRPGLLPADRAAGLPAPDPAAPLAAIARLSFDDLNAIGFFRRDAAGTPLPSDKLAQLRDLWPQGRLVPATPDRAGQGGRAGPAVPLVSVAEKALRVEVSADLMLNNAGQLVRCTIGLECVAPDLLAALAAARAEGAAAADDGSLTAGTLPPRDWRVVGLRTDMEVVSPPLGPDGGPPGARPGL